MHKSNFPVIPSNADAAEGAAQTTVLVLTVNGDARWQFLFSRPDFFIFDFFFDSEELGVPGWVGVYHARWERARAVRRH